MGWGIFTGTPPVFLAVWFCTCLTITCVLVVYDIRHRRLPNGWIIAGLVVILLIAGVEAPHSMSSVLLGASLWSACYFCVALLPKASVGGGDIKLALACGAAVGLTQSATTVLAVSAAITLASILSLVVAGLWPSLRKQIPHGPSMLVSTWLVALLGAPIAVPAT